MVQRLDSELKHQCVYIHWFIYLTNILWSVRQLATIDQQSQSITSETSSMFLKSPPNIPQPEIARDTFQSSRTYPTQKNHQESTINNNYYKLITILSLLHIWFTSWPQGTASSLLVISIFGLGAVDNTEFSDRAHDRCFFRSKKVSLKKPFLLVWANADFRWTITSIVSFQKLIGLLFSWDVCLAIFTKSFKP